MKRKIISDILYEHIRVINEEIKLHKNKKILDIGCGTCEFTKLLNINNNKVYGLDIDDFRNKKFSKNIKFKKYDGNIFPFKDNTFDLITSFDVIEHIENDINFVRETFRILKPNGKVFFLTPNKNRLSSYLKKIFLKPDKFPLFMGDQGPLRKLIHIREYTNSEIKNIFEFIGFKKIKVSNYWLGLMGNISVGINLPILNNLKQYISISAFKPKTK